VGERREFALSHAIALGLLHGPTELLPISSSAHTALLPWLVGWPYDELDPQLRKSFEVALHAGTAAALLVRAPWRTRSQRRAGDGPQIDHAPLQSKPRWDARLGLLAGALAPPALSGYTLGARIERRLGTPPTIAAGLLAGSIVMGAAEMHAHRGCPTHRHRASLEDATASDSTASDSTASEGTASEEGTASSDSKVRAGASLGWREGLLLGIAQSLALFPGISRSGTTFSAARTCGLSRMQADRLSWRVGLPVIAGAALLKGAQLARTGVPSGLRLPFLAGATSASLSTLASTRVLTPARRMRLVGACTVYRGALALLVIRRMRDNTG
jgi:undecaprenyl-diphosphatase